MICSETSSPNLGRIYSLFFKYYYKTYLSPASKRNKKHTRKYLAGILMSNTFYRMRFGISAFHRPWCFRNHKYIRAIIILRSNAEGYAQI